LTCPNFDLCSACEEKNQHPSDHTLLKLKVARQHGRGCGKPRSGGPFGGPQGAFGPFAYFAGRHGHGPHGHGHHGHGPHGHHARGPLHSIFKLFKCLGKKDGFGKHFAKHGFEFGKHGFGKHCGRRFFESDTENRTSKCHRRRHCSRKAEEQAQEKAGTCASEFVKDVNFPDGSIVAPGSLVKHWLLKNSGSTQWPEGSKLIFLRGNRELLGEVEEFPVPLAQPGESVEVSCPISVPAKSGRYSAYFQLADKDRSVFGHRFWIEIIVKAEEKQPVKEVKQPAKEVKQPAKEAQVEDKTKVVQGLSSTLPVEPKYGSALGVLEKMGFVNEKLNLSLLERSQGNIEQVVSWLLEMENSMSR